MPKSRGRKRKPHSTRSHGRPPQGIAEQRRWAAENRPLLEATDRAEARGDAWTALQLILADRRAGRGDDFWRPERVSRLIQPTAFERVLPRWATSRWVLAQACQSLDHRAGVRALQAIDIAVETGGGSGTLLPGVDHTDAMAKVIDHDWVFRQALLYELGGLRDFLARTAAPDLVAGADHIHEWARAPMGAYRFVQEGRHSQDWLDLATQERVTVLNLGSAVLVEPGECVIGRVVPITGGTMFESTPLYVPDDVARTVAGAPREWVATLSAACREMRPRDQQIATRGHDFPLLTDVTIDLMLAQTYVSLDLFTPRPETTALTDDPVAALAAFVRAALDDELRVDRSACALWPAVGAALLHPSVFTRLGPRLTRADAAKLSRLAELLPSPADAVCRTFARDLEEAA